MLLLLLFFFVFNSYIVVAIDFIVDPDVGADNFDTAVDTVDSLNVDKSADFVSVIGGTDIHANKDAVDVNNVVYSC